MLRSHKSAGTWSSSGRVAASLGVRDESMEMESQGSTAFIYLEKASSRQWLREGFCGIYGRQVEETGPETTLNGINFLHVIFKII